MPQQPRALPPGWNEGKVTGPLPADMRVTAGTVYDLRRPQQGADTSAQATTPSTPTSVQLPPGWEQGQVATPDRAGAPPFGFQPPDPAMAEARELDLPSPSPELMRSLLVGGLEMGGAIAAPELLGARLTLAGARRAIPFLVGAARNMALGGAGSAVGNVAGEVGARTLAGEPPLSRAAVGEVLGGGLEAAKRGAVGEAIVPAMGLGFQGLRRAVSMPIARSAARSATEGTRSVRNFLAARGLGIAPSEAGTSSFLATLQNLMEGSPFSSGPWRRFYEARNDALIREVDDLIAARGGPVSRETAGDVLKGALIKDAVQQGEASVASAATRAAAESAPAQQALAAARGAEDLATKGAEDALGAMEAATGDAPGLEVLGEFGQSIIGKARQTAGKVRDAFYESIWKGADESGVAIPIDRLIGRGEALAEEAGELGMQAGTLGRAKGAVTTLQQAGEEAGESGMDLGLRELETLYQSAKAAGNERGAAQAAQLLQEAQAIAGEAAGGALTARQLHRLKSVYGKAGRTLEGYEGGAMKQLFGEASRLLDEGLEGAGLREAYHQAQRAHRAIKETYEEGVLAQLAEKEPARFLEVLKGAKGSVKPIEQAMEVLGPEGAQQVRAQIWRQLAYTGGTRPHRVSAEKLLANIRQYDPDQLRALFGPEGISGLSRVEGALEGALAARGATATAAKGARGAVQDAVAQATTQAAKQVADLQKKNPIQLFNKALGETSTVREVEQLRALVGDDGWKAVQARKLEDWFKGRQPEGITSGADLFRKLPENGDVLRAMFDPNTANFLYQFARVRNRLDKANQARGHVGRVFIQLASAGAATGLATGLATGSPTSGAATGAMIVLSPRILTHIAQDPAMQKALIQGMQLGGASYKNPKLRRVAAHAATQLARMLTAAGLVDGKGREVQSTPPPAGSPAASPASSAPPAASAPSAGAPPPALPPGWAEGTVSGR